MSAFFAIYHGPEGLKSKANHAHLHTLLLAEGMKFLQIKKKLASIIKSNI